MVLLSRPALGGKPLREDIQFDRFDKVVDVNECQKRRIILELGPFFRRRYVIDNITRNPVFSVVPGDCLPHATCLL